MIDLHCHLLPALDDGALDRDTSLAMARLAVADGITTMACTPHILPGVYSNSGPAIRDAVHGLEQALVAEGIALRLVVGADAHVAPDLVGGLRSGKVPTLNGSRYFLLEPPHHILPPRFEEHVFELLLAGYVPILTHPERLSWIEGHYKTIERLVRSGAWVQLTAGSLTGDFGRRARYWAERMLDEQLVHLLASDAHGTGPRAPLLSPARELAARRFGEEAATALVLTRPQGILDDRDPSELSSGAQPSMAADPVPSLWRRLFDSARRG